MKKKILCVIRVSTENQETESQHNDMAKWLSGMGYKESEIVWLESAGASARSLNQKYLDLLEEIKRICTEDGIKSVAIWHINRLGRVESKLMEMKEFFVKNKVQLYIKQSNITLLDDNGNLTTGGSLVFSMFSAMVAEETAEMMDKMKRGKATARAKGLYTGGAIMYGYTTDENGKLIINEDEAKVIRTAFEMYAADENKTKQSSMKIAQYLNDNNFCRRTGYFSSSRLHKFIRQEKYRGVFVPVELFDKCQKISDDNYKGGKERRMSLGERLIKCAKCGHNYRLVAGKAYVCNQHREEYKGTDRYCSNQKQLNKQLLDATLVETVAAWWLDATRKNDKERSEEIREQIKSAEDLLKANAAKMTALSERKRRTALNYANELFDDDTYNSLIVKIRADEKQLKDEHNDIESRLRDLNYQMSDECESLKTWADYFDDFDSLTHAELYDVIHKIVDRVEVEINDDITRTEWTIYRKDSSDKQTYIIKGWGAGRKLYGIINDKEIDLSKEPRFKQTYDANIKRQTAKKKTEPSALWKMWQKCLKDAA